MTRTLSVCFVTVNTFEYDSRTLRAARALAADGHRVTVVAQRGPGLEVVVQYWLYSLVWPRVPYCFYLL
jgi:hypothetical protein